MTTNESPPSLNANANNAHPVLIPPSYTHDGTWTPSESNNERPCNPPAIDLPRQPPQIHLHCYPPTRTAYNVQNANDSGTFSIPQSVLDNPSRSPHVVEQCLNTLTNAALSAALTPDSGAGGISLQMSRDNAPAADSLPLPAATTNRQNRRQIGSVIVEALFLLTVGIIIAIRVLV